MKFTDKFILEQTRFMFNKIRAAGMEMVPAHAVFVINDSDVEVIQLAEFMDHGAATKDLIRPIILLGIEAMAPQAVAIITETWMVQANINDERAKRIEAGKESVRQQPDRKEALLVQIDRNDKSSVTYTGDIVGNTLTEWTKMDLADSRWGKFFDEPPRVMGNA